MKKLFIFALGLTFSLLASSQVQQMPQRVVTDPGGGVSIFIGQGAGKTTTNANITAMLKGFFTCVGYNTCGAIGVGMTAAGTNSENTALGWSAGSAWTTGTFNTALGVGTQRNETTGTNNTAVGVDSMGQSIATQGNVAVGVGTFKYGTSGANNNTAVGNGALGGTSLGLAINNVAVGFNALVAETTGSSNVAVGFFAGHAQVAQGNNTYVGSNAGLNATGNHNTYVVANGTATCVSGSTNILLGYGLDCAASGTANIIGIGGTGSTYVWGATGTGTPSTATTTIAGGLTLPNVTTGTNADFVCMAAGGVLTLQTSACTISSLRFKKDVHDIGSSVIPEIARMEVASFKMKEREKPNADPNFGTRQTGLIAENIAQVAPECAVYENDMKTPKSYRQECIIALLVRATQEQQQEIRALKRRLR